jgi:hypothetical protein
MTPLQNPAALLVIEEEERIKKNIAWSIPGFSSICLFFLLLCLGSDIVSSSTFHLVAFVNPRPFFCKTN